MDTLVVGGSTLRIGSSTFVSLSSPPSSALFCDPGIDPQVTASLKFPGWLDTVRSSQQQILMRGKEWGRGRRLRLFFLSSFPALMPWLQFCPSMNISSEHNSDLIGFGITISTPCSFRPSGGNSLPPQLVSRCLNSPHLFPITLSVAL